MNEIIWISDAPSDTTLGDTNLSNGWNVDRKDALIELATAARQGRPINPPDFPKRVWGEMDGYRAWHTHDL